MVVEVEHPELGKVCQVGVGIKLPETPGSIRRTAPLRGEHTDEVLQSLGYDQGAVAELHQQGAVG